MFNFFFPWAATTGTVEGNNSRCPPEQQQEQQQQEQQRQEQQRQDSVNEPYNNLIDYSSVIKKWERIAPPRRKRLTPSSITTTHAQSSNHSEVPIDTESQIAKLEFMERHLSLLGDLLEEQSRLQSSFGHRYSNVSKLEIKPLPPIESTPAPLSSATLPKEKAIFDLKSGNWQ